MKYAELQNKNIEDLNQRVEALGDSLYSLRDDITDLKDSIGKELVEHELNVLTFRKRIDLLKHSLFELIEQRDREQEQYDIACKKLDQSRFDAFRDDRGESVESLPVGPLAIVPLGSNGPTPPDCVWTDEDAHIIHGTGEKKESIIDFKGCHHIYYAGPFVKYNGTYTCNNCKVQELACFDCKKELKD
jgi:hypothetical protein